MTTSPDPTYRRRPTAIIAVTAAMAVVAAALLAAMLSSNTASAVLQEEPTPEVATVEPDDADDAEDHGEWDDSDWDVEWDMDVPPEFEAFEACADNIWDGTDEADVDDAELEERFEAECIALLPEAEQTMIAAFGPFDDCLDSQLGDEVEIDDDAFEAAEAACADLLPDEVKEFEAAFEAFETCLTENGVPALDEDELGQDGAVVIVIGPDGEQMISLGQDSAGVTITSDGTEVTVETSGDASTIDIDHDAHDVAFEACEALLPEGDFMPFGLGEYDDDYDEED